MIADAENHRNHDDGGNDDDGDNDDGEGDDDDEYGCVLVYQVDSVIYIIHILRFSSRHKNNFFLGFKLYRNMWHENLFKETMTFALRLRFA